jgi:probable rRNA maturation factor
MVTEKKLQILAGKILKTLKVRGATLDIFLLRHQEIKTLKAQFIKKKTEPNVLAFPEPGLFVKRKKDKNGAFVFEFTSDHFPHPETKKIQLGEIYLNSDILNKSPERVAPLLLHGILHLLGYDHIKKSDAPEMEALEKKILEVLE